MAYCNPYFSVASQRFSNNSILSRINPPISLKYSYIRMSSNLRQAPLEVTFLFDFLHFQLTPTYVLFCTIICIIFTSICKKLVKLTWVFSRSFSMPCASFSMLLVLVEIIHIIVQDQDGQNNNNYKTFSRIKQCFYCQGFSHKAEFCNLCERCVKCVGDHNSSTCTKVSLFMSGTINLT